VGTTQVDCIARDIYDNEATCSFDVIVRDTEAPAIVCNSPIDTGTCLGYFRRRTSLSSGSPRFTSGYRMRSAQVRRAPCDGTR
jgi:hypothetical protein